MFLSIGLEIQSEASDPGYSLIESNRNAAESLNTELRSKLSFHVHGAAIGDAACSRGRR